MVRPNKGFLKATFYNLIIELNLRKIINI